ncbi:hypothetical protein AgCh_037754 [Apium graveolens]
MSMRLSRDCDACDGDGQCEFCSVEFHLSVKCVGDQHLDVTSANLIAYDPNVVPVDYPDLGDSEQSSEPKRIGFKD